MSTNTKIVLGISGALLLLCACAAVATAWLFQPVNSVLEQTQGLVGGAQPAKVEQVAQGIADFQLPADYTGQYAMSIGHFELAVYAPKTYKGHLILMQLPPGATADAADMERHLREQTRDLNYAQYTHVRTISSSQATIRGQSGTVMTSEGTNSSGDTYRLAHVIFQGKDGLAYILIAAPLAHWNQAEVDALIASLR